MLFKNPHDLKNWKTNSIRSLKHCSLPCETRWFRISALLYTKLYWVAFPLQRFILCVEAKRTNDSFQKSLTFNQYRTDTDLLLKSVSNNKFSYIMVLYYLILELIQFTPLNLIKIYFDFARSHAMEKMFFGTHFSPIRAHWQVRRMAWNCIQFEGSCTSKTKWSVWGALNPTHRRINEVQIWYSIMFPLLKCM